LTAHNTQRAVAPRLIFSRSRTSRPTQARRRYPWKHRRCGSTVRCRTGRGNKSQNPKEKKKSGEGDPPSICTPSSTKVARYGRPGRSAERSRVRGARRRTWRQEGHRHWRTSAPTFISSSPLTTLIFASVTRQSPCERPLLFRIKGGGDARSVQQRRDGRDRCRRCRRRRRGDRGPDEERRRRWWRRRRRRRNRRRKNRGRRRRR
jgi:hypothetical protein